MLSFTVAMHFTFERYCTVALYFSVVSEMIVGDNIDKKDSAVKCLEVLSTCQSHHWKSILDAGQFTIAIDQSEEHKLLLV